MTWGGAWERSERVIRRVHLCTGCPEVLLSLVKERWTCARPNLYRIMPPWVKRQPQESPESAMPGERLIPAMQRARE